MTDQGKRVAAEILAGRLDDSIAAVYQAILTRADQLGGLPWLITTDWGTISELDITLDEYTAVVDALHVDFAAVPSPLDDPAVVPVIAAVVAASRWGRTRDEVLAELGRRPVVEVLRMISRGQPPAPLGSPAASTTSEAAPSSSDGQVT